MGDRRTEREALGLLPFTQLKDCAFLSPLQIYPLRLAQVTGQLWKCSFEAEHSSLYALPPDKAQAIGDFNIPFSKTWLYMLVPLHACVPTFTLFSQKSR